MRSSDVSTTGEQTARVAERLLSSFEERCRTPRDEIVQCHLLLCARALGLSLPVFVRMVDKLERTRISPDVEESSVVGTFLRQLTLLQYSRGLDERREFLLRWLDPERFGRHDMVTISWLMGLAAEEQELIRPSRRAYAQQWFLRHSDLTSIRARAWVPHYLELWGYDQEAARVADSVLADRGANGSWPHGPPVAAAAGYALATARSTNRRELARTADYVTRRLDRGLDTADVAYPLNALKLLFLVGRITSVSLERLRTRLHATVFLSHASVDKVLARRLAADLQARGVRVWFDEAEIQPGDSIIGKLESGLSDSRFVFLLASRASLSSRWVLEELRAAQHDAIATGIGRVVPIRVDDTPFPPFLLDKKYLTVADYDGCLRDLLRLCGIE